MQQPREEAMTDFSRSAVDAALLRELEQGIDRIEALAKKDWPVRLECSRLRGFVAALRKPARPSLRLVPYDLVQTSGQMHDAEIERQYVGDDRGARLAEKPDAD